MIDDKTAQRFWAKVAISGEDDCWPWNGSVNGSTPRFNPYKSGLSPHAIRSAYMLANGEIPEGKRVRHTCQSLTCCNPKHLILSSELEERFWSKVDKAPGLGPNGDCWEWIGYIKHTGYGEFSFAHSKRVLAHRLAYELVNGNKLGELFACHKCDNRRCVNPDHIFPGTQLDNQQDMTKKGRHRFGVKNGRAVLTEEDIPEVRRLLALGETQQAIAEKFGVTQTAISSVNTGRRWSHVD